jgi:hypothetical protein
MKINYVLIDNSLVPGRNRAVLQKRKMLTYDQFLDHVHDAGTTLTRTDMIAAIQVMYEWIASNASFGREVDFGPLGHTRLGLAGDFDSNPESPRQNQWKMTIKWQASPKLKKAVDIAAHNSGLKRGEVQSYDPRILKVTCFQDRDVYSPGLILELYGRRMRFDEQREDEGVFFQAEDAGPGVKPVRAKNYQTNTPSRIILLIPKNLSGPQKLLLRARKDPEDKWPLEARYRTILQQI